VLASEHASREHALFLRRWDGVFVEDLGSRNGVKVDGQLIVGRARLGDGARIEVGGTLLRLDDPEDRYLQELAARDDASAPEPAPPSDRGAPASSKASTSSAPGRGATPSLGHATAAAATALSAPTRVRRASARAGALRPAPNVPRRPQASRARTAIIVAATALLVLATSGLIVLLTRWT